MVDKNESLSPIQVYQAIIDELVEHALRYGPAVHVREKGIYSKAIPHRAFNEFIATLSAEQREILAQMLQAARSGAFFDVLAAISWWVDCRELGFTVGGKPMPVDLSGEGLHGDFIGREQGWDWPTEKT